MTCPDDDRCGTIRAWLDGCRLIPCDAAATAIRDTFHAVGRERLSRLKVDLPAGVDHGTRQGAHYYGCGCNPCHEAAAVYARQRRKLPRHPPSKKDGHT